MARPAFTLGDLIPSKFTRSTISGSASIKGLVNISVKNIPGDQILAGFERAINRASNRIKADMEIALRAAMLANAWKTPSGQADIYDTGELLSSGTVTVDSDGITISYDAPYAALVHYGGYINPYGNQSARVYLPPRPWVESVLNGGGPVPQFDIASYYEQEIRAEFS